MQLLVSLSTGHMISRKAVHVIRKLREVKSVLGAFTAGRGTPTSMGSSDDSAQKGHCCNLRPRNLARLAIKFHIWLSGHRKLLRCLKLQSQIVTR